ncbi:hypothetical protein OH76DRAFT_1407900 [Lentinus brumalis]|uniref:Uncharacterized protein n=1 Tax=Lentinus brumalis TaxID=2498619 RepID=A0A371CZ02_9APHY|nr:hypothetical protein OH76DRAFT_1407900 [Polyporus brumalis]
MTCARLLASGMGASSGAQSHGGLDETDTEYTIPIYCHGLSGLLLHTCSFEGPTDVTPRYGPAANTYIVEGIYPADTPLDAYLIPGGLVVYQHGSTIVSPN